MPLTRITAAGVVIELLAVSETLAMAPTPVYVD